MVGDEGRYLKFASNLSQGYYTSKNDINLTNGPGYPIVLLPFVAFRIPLIVAKLMNSVFLYLSVLYFYYTLSLYMKKLLATVFAYLLGIYPIIVKYLPTMLTEVFAVFLICGFIFHFCKLHQNNGLSWRHIFGASVYLSFLALTRTIFGYVILFGLLFLPISYLFTRKKTAVKSFLMLLVALIFCSPYLAYTYALTGKVFYWGTNGGEVLYWMSTPYENEYGDWFGRKKIYEINRLSINHMDFYNELESLSKFEEDKIFKVKAIENIAQHPSKYLRNWIANIGRLLFNYPRSYIPQKIETYFYIIPNMFIVVLSILCIYPFYLGRKLVPYEIKGLVVSSLVYIGGSSLVSAVPRYFAIIVPVIILWISFTVTRIIKFEIQN